MSASLLDDDGREITEGDGLLVLTRPGRACCARSTTIRPEEIARVVAFLAADESGYITGQLWAVNGGLDM